MLTMALYHTSLMAQALNQDVIYCGNTPASGFGNGSFTDAFGNGYEVYELQVPTGLRNVACNCSLITSPFQLVFEDCNLQTGTGFDDPVDGKARRDVLCRVFHDLAQLIEPNLNPCAGTMPVVYVQVQPSHLSNYNGRPLPPLANNIGGIGGPYYYDGATGLADGLPWILINSGKAPKGTEQIYHGIIRINFDPQSNFKWHLNADTDPDPDLHDLYTVCMHEALHLLGIGSFIDASNGSPLGSVPGAPGGYSRYDAFLRLGFTPVITNNPSPGLNWFLNIPASPLPYCNAAGVAPDLSFSNGTSGLPVYSGFSPNNGAFSHFDADCDPKNLSPYVMSPAIGKGVRNLITDSEKDALCTLGYHLRDTPCDCSIGGANDERVGCDGPPYEVPVCSTLIIREADLLANDVNATAIQFLEVSNPADGTLSPHPLLPRTYIFTPLKQGLITLIYVAVGCSGKVSNKTYVYIRVINKGCAHSCNGEPLSCTDSLRSLIYRTCDAATNCDKLSGECNLICNASICGTVFHNYSSNNHFQNDGGYIFPNGPSIGILFSLPGWVRTHGTPDFHVNTVHVKPGSGAIALAGGFLVTDTFGGFRNSEGVMNFVHFKKNTHYLLSFDAKTFLIKIPPTAPPPGARAGKMKIDLIDGDKLNIVSNAYNFRTPSYPNQIFNILSPEIKGESFERRGKCFMTDAESYNSVWFHYDADYEPSFIGPLILFDKVELVEDDFTAGPDRLAGPCGATIQIGGKFCMLSNVGIEYEWVDMGTGQVIGKYRVMNGLATVLLGNINTTTHQISVSPLQNTTYRLRRSIYDAGGMPADFALCTNFDDITVAVTTASPNASFTHTATTCNAIQFRSAALAGHTHEWDFGDHSPFSTIADPLHTYPFSSGTYTVTHRVTNECGATSTFTAQVVISCQGSCACPAGYTANYTIGTDPGSVTALSSLTGLASLADHICFYIQGTLNVDVHWEARNCFFRMGEAAQIVVRSGMKLTLANNTFEGCDRMWYRILEDRASITASQNTIRDAQYGFHFTSPVSALTTDNTFDKCYVGIYGAPVSPRLLLSGKTIVSVDDHFICTGTLKPAYTGQAITSYSSRTYAGVWVRSVNGIYLYKSDFKDLRNGAVASNTLLTMEECTVENLENVGTRGIAQANPNLNNFCVWADNCANVLLKNNFFTGHWYGVYNRNSNLQVNDNQFYGYISNQTNELPGFGIYVSSCHNRDVEIKNNTAIEVSGDGICLLNSQFLRCYVYQNNITMHREKHFGMRLDNARFGLVKNNGVQHPFSLQHEAGIHLMNTSDFDFIGNQLYGGKYGVDANGGVNNYFNLNRATMLSVEPTESKTETGFHALMSQGQYCANITEGWTGFNTMDKGFWFEGLCDPSPFQCQQIGPASEHGLLLAQDGVIGENTAAGGNLDNTWTDSDARHEGTDPLFVLQSQMINDPGEEPAWSTAAGNNQDVPWFISLLTPDNCPSSCPQSRFPDGNTPEAETATAPAEEGDVYATEDSYPGVAQNWMVQQRLYARLQQNPAGLSGNNAFAQFHAAASSGAMGQLYGAEEAARQSLRRSVAGRQQIRALQQGIAQEISNLAALYTAGASSSIIDTKESELAVSLDLWSRFEAYWKEGRRTETATLLPIVQAISSPNMLAANERNLGILYLQNHLWEDERPDEGALLQIKSIADQCPAEGGFAVFAARAWYRYFEPKARWTSNSCLQSRPTTAISNTTPLSDLKVWPNPATDRLQVIFDTEPAPESRFLLFDATGVKTFDLPLNHFSGTLDISGVPPGFYFYAVRSQDSVIQGSKIIIIR